MFETYDDKYQAWGHRDKMIESFLLAATSSGPVGALPASSERVGLVRDAVTEASKRYYGDDRRLFYLSIKEFLEFAGRKDAIPGPSVFYGGKANLHLEILRYRQRGQSSQAVADAFGMSLTALDEYTKEMANGLRIFDSEIQPEVRRGGVFPTTVHPVLLPANLSEVYALLVALLEPKREVSREEDLVGTMNYRTAGKIWFQLSKEARDLLAKALEDNHGIKPPEEQEPNLTLDSEEIDFAIVCEEKRKGKRVRVTYQNGGRTQTLYGILQSKTDENGRKRFSVKGSGNPKKWFAAGEAVIHFLVE